MEVVAAQELLGLLLPYLVWLILAAVVVVLPLTQPREQTVDQVS
jgi:tryptophan-rich sensory protein